MGDPKKDLEQKFTQLSSIVEEYSKVYRREQDARLTIEILRKELEDMRESERVLQEHFKNVFDMTEFNCTVEYASLLDSHRRAKEKVNELTCVIRQMKKEHQEEIVNVRSALENEYSSDKKALIDRIAELERSEFNNRAELEKKENHLYEQLQLEQTNAAVRFDEMETKYKVSLDKAANEHRSLMNTCNALRAEIFNIKSQMRSGVGFVDNNKSNYEEKIKTLQSELNTLKEQYGVQQNKLEYAEAQLKAAVNDTIEINEKTNKTKPEQNAINTVINVDECEAPFQSNNEHQQTVNQHNRQFEVTENDDFDDSMYVLKKNHPQTNRWSRNVPIFKMPMRGSSGGYRNRAFCPPLIPTANTEKTKKKRKLYDPDDDSNV